MRGRRLEKTGSVSLEYVEVFSDRERRRLLQIVCRSRMALLGQTPRYHRRSRQIFCHPPLSSSSDGGRPRAITRVMYDSSSAKVLSQWSILYNS
jgi:hypothetical protein